jgi:hypothetical protein
MLWNFSPEKSDGFARVRTSDLGKQISNFMKNRPVGDEFIHVDGQTDSRKDMT